MLCDQNDDICKALETVAFPFTIWRFNISRSKYCFSCLYRLFFENRFTIYFLIDKWWNLKIFYHVMNLYSTDGVICLKNFLFLFWQREARLERNRNRSFFSWSTCVELLFILHKWNVRSNSQGELVGHYLHDMLLV